MREGGDFIIILSSSFCQYERVDQFSIEMMRELLSNHRRRSMGRADLNNWSILHSGTAQVSSFCLCQRDDTCIGYDQRFLISALCKHFELISPIRSTNILVRERGKGAGGLKERSQYFLSPFCQYERGGQFSIVMRRDLLSNHGRRSMGRADLNNWSIYTVEQPRCPALSVSNGCYTY